MATPDDMPSGERRAVPPASLDVIAYQVGALQTSLDRGLGGLERTIDRGLADLRVEIAGLTQRVGDMEKQWERVDTRVIALETFRREREAADKEAAKLQQADLKLALGESAEARLTRKLAFILIGGLGAVGTVITVLAAIGVFQ